MDPVGKTFSLDKHNLVRGITSPHLSSLSSVAHKAPKFSTFSVGISAFASQISDVSEKKLGEEGGGHFLSEN